MKKQKILCLKGLPASGKTTYAKELKGYKRVNKDDLRAMIDNGVWGKENEKAIKFIEQQIVKTYIKSGFNVVVDDTNFAQIDAWKNIAKGLGADFEEKFFDVPVAECVERDAKRGTKSVGAKVIFGMYNSYLKPKPPALIEGLPSAYIVDIDGTLAKMNGRSPYDYSKVSTDLPNNNVITVINALRGAGHTIHIVSGRDNVCEADTVEWLAKYGVLGNYLSMRKNKDVRKDTEVKREIYEKHIKGKYNVLGVFDDRNQVVDLWRSLGLTTMQVDYGNF